jgi:ribose transport system permease protein
VTAKTQPESGTTGHRLLGPVLQRLPRYGLLLVGLALILVFSALRPDSFPTVTNFNAILGNKTIDAFLALAVMIPMVTKHFDLSVGYGMGLTYVLSISLQVRYDVPWPLVIVIVLLVGLLLGLLNGLLVEFGQIDSFIATLGTGTVVYAITLWHTGGQQVAGDLPAGFTKIDSAKLFGIHAPSVLLILVAILLWLAFEYLPIGRYLYAVGANRRAAELNGIRAGRFVIGAFMMSGLLTATAGILFASRLQVGQSNVGLDYLLPAFVGALLGSTTIHAGRVNVWGTIVAVAVLAIGISGIQQLGSSFFVEPLFNGLTLIAAVGIAGYAARRRVRVRKKQEEVSPTPPDVAPVGGSLTAQAVGSQTAPVPAGATPADGPRDDYPTTGQA